jgi:hypothetical protein
MKETHVMNKFTRAFVLGFAASALTLTGCATTGSSAGCADCAEPAECSDCEDPANCEKCSGEAATIGASNDACPFSGKDINPDIETVSFQGKEVGFCCGGCAGKFAEMTDAEKTTLLDS